MAAKGVGRAILADALRLNAEARLAEGMTVFKEHRAEFSIGQLTQLIRSCEARNQMKELFTKYNHCLLHTFKGIADFSPEFRLNAARELIQTTSQQFSDASISDRIAAYTAFMHVHTTCGYQATKQVPAMYADVTSRAAAQQASVSMATCLVMARSLLLLKQFGALELFVEQVRRDNPTTTPLAFTHLLLDMYNELHDYEKAMACFHDTVAMYQSATPYMFDAITRSSIEGKMGTRFQALLYVRLYEMGILLNEVSPVTRNALCQAFEHETRSTALPPVKEEDVPPALRHTFLPQDDPKLAALARSGGVYHLEHFKHLLTPALEHKLKTGKYPQSGADEFDKAVGA